MPIYLLSPSTILVVEVIIKLNNMIDDKIKDTDTFVDLSKEDKDALDTWAHYCKQHEGYERNEEGN